jgi:hypothetical protein
MVRACVLFEVRTEFLNIIYTSLAFKGLLLIYTQFAGQYDVRFIIFLIRMFNKHSLFHLRLAAHRIAPVIDEWDL